MFSKGRTNSERAAGARKMDGFSMFSKGRTTLESAAGARKIRFLVPLASASGISSEIPETSENPLLNRGF